MNTHNLSFLCFDNKKVLHKVVVSEQRPFPHATPPPWEVAYPAKGIILIIYGMKIACFIGIAYLHINIILLYLS